MKSTERYFGTPRAFGDEPELYQSPYLLLVIPYHELFLLYPIRDTIATKMCVSAFHEHTSPHGDDTMVTNSDVYIIVELMVPYFTLLVWYRYV